MFLAVRTLCRILTSSYMAIKIVLTVYFFPAGLTFSCNRSYVDGFLVSISASFKLKLFFAKRTLEFHDCQAEVWKYNCEHSTYKPYDIKIINDASSFRMIWEYIVIPSFYSGPISVYTKLCVKWKIYITKHYVYPYIKDICRLQAFVLWSKDLIR